ncbi:hypothetical protein RCL1_002904 [Eukaryota sp. TZLM3-RCL]
MVTKSTTRRSSKSWVPQKKKKTHSSIWLKWMEEKLIDSVKYAVCKCCRREFKISNGTSAALNHLDNQHPGWINKEPTECVPKITSLLPLVSAEEPVTEPETSLCPEATMLLFFLESNSSFKMIELDSFTSLLELAGVPVYGRKTLKHRIMNYCETAKRALSEYFMTMEGQVSLTMDMWTSQGGNPYLGITAHLVDESFHLKSFVLACKKIPHPHTAAMINVTLIEVLRSFNLEGKIFSITTDNADNIVNAVKEIPGIYHRRCAAHLINLTVKAGMDKIKATTQKIRNVAIQLNQSSASKQRFLQQSGGVTLPGDCSTRWNSTFLMLDAARTQETAYRLVAEPENRLEYSEKLSLSDIADFLKPFYSVTVKLNGKNYPTSGSVLLLIQFLGTHVLEHSSSENPTLKAVSSLMLEKHRKYIDEMFNYFGWLSSFLDPRYKLTRGPMFPCEDQKYLSRLRGELGVVESSTVGQSVSDEDDDDDLMVKAVKLARDQKSSSRYQLKHPHVDEVAHYISESILKLDGDPLLWWAENRFKFPNLAIIARNVFSAPATGVPSESLFSLGGRIVTDVRCSLGQETVEALACCNSWVQFEKLKMLLNEVCSVMYEDHIDTDDEIFA